MRVLKSACLGLSAGISTIVLAVAIRLVSETVDIEITKLVFSVISLVSAGSVMHVFVWRIHTDASRPVFSRKHVGWAVPIVLFFVIQTALSRLVFDSMGTEGDWLEILSIVGLFTAAFISAVTWETERVKRGLRQ